jgi:hypothetical protein
VLVLMTIACNRATCEYCSDVMVSDVDVFGCSRVARRPDGSVPVLGGGYY